MQFSITSTEHRSYKQEHKCVVISQIDNKLLIRLENPIPSFVYSTDKDIELFLLSPRYVDQILVPEPSELPCRVNACLPMENKEWENGPWRTIDIWELSKI